MVIAVGNFLKQYRAATGNLELQEVHDGTRATHTWDAENRLILAETPTALNTMTYRGDGLRVEKQDGDGTTRFIWDGANILCETDGNNNYQNFYTVQPLAYGNLISQYRSGPLASYYHFDGLGSTDRLTNAAEAVTDSYVYQAYGKQVASSGTTINPFLWVGRVGYFEDAELDQYYVRARHYEPGLARWLSQDPIGFESNRWNLYAYAGGSPLVAIDPSALYAVCCATTYQNLPIGVPEVDPKNWTV